MSGAETLWFTITTVVSGASILLLTDNIVISGAVVLFFQSTVPCLVQLCSALQLTPSCL